MLFTVNTGLIILLEVPLNVAMAHWPHRRALVLGAALNALGFGALAVVTLPWMIVATAVAWTFGEMIFFPVSAAYVADIAPPSRVGEYMGAYTMAFGLAFLCAPWAGAALIARYGPGVTWGAAFAVGMAAVLVLVGMPERESAPAAQEPLVADD
jgi:MFS family permease